MLKERGEDDTVVDVEETWDGEEGYTKRTVLYAYYRSSINNQSTLSRIKFGDLYNGSFYPAYTTLEWSTSDGDDGRYIYRDGDSIVVQSAKDNSKTLKYFSFSVSPDNQYVLLAANKTKGWRYSFTANYYVFNISSKQTLPITTPIDTTHQVTIAQAKWSSAFVKDNDLYISVDLKEERRVTYDGSTVVFNGVPDWIYEEEVLANNFAFWWSPNSTQIAYLRLNESLVPEYRFPLYLNGLLATPYAKEVIMKYPKPGYPNPVVTFHIYDTSTPLVSQSAAIPFTNDFGDTDKIITEVCWAGNDNVLVRVMNRVQDIARVVLVDANNRSGVTVREENAETRDGGWFEITRSMVYLNNSGGITQDSYADVVVNNGYNHLAIFSPLNNATPRYLTSGNWEVVGGVKAIDYTLQLVYFMSTEKSSIERHLYSVSFDGLTKTALTNTDEAGYYEVSFSKGAKYYNIKYEGPEIPWQKVLKVDNSSFSVSLQDNNKLKSLIKTIDMPTIKYSTVESDGNIRPPGMDETGREKYPVLFHVYGGPTSQLVNKKFFFDWHLYVASKLKFVVVTVDTRGTGYLGRTFRVCVRKHLGEYESIDSINTAKLWAKLPYVDSSKIAIWGWSFGGFLTSKVIEADSGVFQAGMAVAPAAVTNMTGFSNAQFLLVHGTVDKFTLGSVHNYRLQFYTDNDHSIAKHNANRE
ncbi:6513_t:CDS:10, partial [Diversispora eburnea]